MRYYFAWKLRNLLSSHHMYNDKRYLYTFRWQPLLNKIKRGPNIAKHLLEELHNLKTSFQNITKIQEYVLYGFSLCQIYLLCLNSIWPSQENEGGGASKQFLLYYVIREEENKTKCSSDTEISPFLQKQSQNSSNTINLQILTKHETKRIKLSINYLLKIIPKTSNVLPYIFLSVTLHKYTVYAGVQDDILTLKKKSSQKLGVVLYTKYEMGTLKSCGCFWWP